MQETHYQIKGMSQDLAYQLFNPQYAFECKNIRINTTDENSFLSLTSEQGTQEICSIEHDGNKVTILGIGQFSDFCILFGKIESSNNDIILRFNADTTVEELFVSDDTTLNFDTDYPIKTVCVYENEAVQKIYWIDGKNPPRVINVAKSTSNITVKPLRDQKFEFLPKLKFGEKVTIDKTSGGQFPAGVIQYAITYSDKGLQESNLWYISPVHYITNSDSGAEPGSICNTAFKLNFENLDTKFDYLQIYAIIRTSINAVPMYYRIANVPTTVTSFTDNGSQWEASSAEEVLGKQLGTFIPKTITSKDATLFLGNYTLQSPIINRENYEPFIKGIADSLEFSFNKLSTDNKSNSLKTFRSGEIYRIGIQFQDEYGTPSNVIYLNDIEAPTGDSNSAEFGQKLLRATIKNLPENFKFRRARLMMVDRTTLIHKTICQGVLCPTVYTLIDRVSNLPFAMNSWCMRGYDENTADNPTWEADAPLRIATANGGEIQNQGDYKAACKGTNNNLSVNEESAIISVNTSTDDGITYFYILKVLIRDEGWGPEAHILFRETTAPEEDDISVETANYQHRITILDYGNLNADLNTNEGLKEIIATELEIALKGMHAPYPDLVIDKLVWEFNPYYEYKDMLDVGWVTWLNNRKWSTGINMSLTEAVALAKDRGNPFYCDHNILTFHSPDIEKYQTLIDNNSSIKYRVVGYTNIKESVADYNIQLSHASRNENGGLQPINKSANTGVPNVRIWKDDDIITKSNDWQETNSPTLRLYPVYTWHRSTTLGTQQQSIEGKWFGEYSKKIFSNVHTCGMSYAFRTRSGKVLNAVYPKLSPSLEDDDVVFPLMGTPRVFNSDEIIALQLEDQPHGANRDNKLIYYGNVKMAYTDKPYYVPVVSKSTDEIEYLKNTNKISDPCLIQYKSTPHVVMPMSYYVIKNDQENPRIFAPSLPRIKNTGIIDKSKYGYLWSTVSHGFARPSIGGIGANNIKLNPNLETLRLLYIAELYQEVSASDIYGGTDKDSIAHHTWLPIGEWVVVDKSAAVLQGYGDTFIGRWECLKTHVFSADEAQGYNDITSLIVESDINLESRYDKFSGIKEASKLDISKFNLYNSVYDQQDNLFTYSSLTDNESLNDFTNQICWSGVKTLGEELDTWCQINVGVNTDVQGEYGILRNLVTYKNSIYCFQDNAVYKLNYNARTAVSTDDNLPIQISSNYNVESPLLLKDNCGINNFNQVVKTSNALYFLDSSRRRIFTLGEDDVIKDLSGAKGVNSLLYKLGNPKRVLSDSIIQDVYFNFENISLGFNEELMEFTSLYSYHKADYLFSLDSTTYAICDNKIFKQRDGEYGSFLGENDSYYIELLANEYPTRTKTFTNVDFYSSAGGPIVFDNIDTKTSYQEGSAVLNWSQYKPSNVKRKFRLWRINIPRDKENSLDRMRDTWCRIKLTKNNVNNMSKFKINYIGISHIPD